MASTSAKPPRPFILYASTLARAHTCISLAAFLSALLIGGALHYKKIVKNGVAGYPEEWFPSVSSTIGDWYPERSIFQILIAINSGPRFILVALQYYLQRNPHSSFPGFLLLVGILRTLSCGGWVYITSSDDHDAHDVLMIGYIMLNIPWMFGSIACTPVSHVASRRRRRLASFTFFAALVPMIYFFIQHKVHRVPGAYTRYSFFEWSLIFLDVLYDSSAELDFKAADLKITVGTLVGGSSETDKIVASTAEVAATPLPPVNEKDAKQAGHKPADAVAVLPAAAQHPSILVRARPAIAFASDVYLSYIFWSVYTALVPTLFYFSVWELGFAAHELALLATLSPVLLGIPPMWEWATSREGRAILHGFTLVGLAAYIVPSPLGRLFLVAFASASTVLGVTVDWLGGEGEDVVYQAIVAGLGFLVSSLSKHANHTNNPVWPFVDGRSGGYNKTGIALALLAILEYASRPSAPAASATKSPKAAASAPTHHWIPASLALGALLFSLHALLADASTLIAWSWTGFPIRGPVPAVHGSLTHVAQVLGLGLAAFLPHGVRGHPLWLAWGVGSAYVMYAYRDWAGYAGGLGFAAFLMGAIPTVWARAAQAGRGREARTMVVACLVVIVYDVASTFTVAYAFVPGGEIFRERTDLVLISQVALIALAFDWRLPRRAAPPSSPAATSLPRAAHYRVQYTLVLLTALSLFASLWRASWPAVVPRPHREAARIVRAGIWTVHFGIDNEGRDSQRRMRDLIKDMELDVVGLLETDLHRIPFGNRDLTRVIAEELGYYVDIGPGPNQHTWGAVLLSKFPILNSTHHLLPSPDGELAPAIEAVLDMFGTEVTVVVSHNGQEETPLDRELQSTELARIMAEADPRPVIFLGYVVTKPLAPRPAPYEIMVTDGRVHDIDADDYDRWCEYIFYRGLYRTAYARISRSTITDTEMQIGQFVVPRRGAGVVDDSQEARYMRAWKEELPEDHWFPMEYYEQYGGMRGHFYHVFNTPLYYKIPEGAQV
ncbi:Protein cwh43 [Trametes pubescens]|uniref:Protein cwh43 n=1 Tax=Trametes pubescens TaxID=154538 RepID=A0A1M2VE79_TRAPU|nr:Protein cwh43 [Trametes pubescens]